MTKKEFIDKANEKYSGKYDYSIVKDCDVMNEVNVPIRCDKHGLFWETPHMHLYGLVGGCFKCYAEKNWPGEQKK